jgi:phenylacetate-CoA ligase
MKRDRYGALCSLILFPMHERLKGHTTVARLRELEKSQWWPAERLRELQLTRLKTFITAVARDIPYYSRAFSSHGFVSSRVQSIANLSGAPLLTKALIRANPSDLTLPGARLKRYNTGGSSGEPLVFFIGSDRRSHDIAAKWRATRWFGVDIGDPEIVVWGSPVELNAQDRLRTWRDRLLRTELLPAFQMSERSLDHFIARIRARRPKMLFGYPSALSHIARHAERCGVRMDDLGVEVAFVTAERLYDDQRATIARVFGCKVANGYGGRDAGFIAHDCPSGGMHISAEDIVVETIDAEGTPTRPGEAGEIVVTHLATSEFPFIRYRTGDVGMLDDKQCACGRGLPLLKEIQGRTTDFIHAVDGTMMHGLALIYTVRDLPGVREFKIVQHTRERVEVVIVADSAFGAAEQRRIVSDFRVRLGAAVDVAITRVDCIAPERSGKYRYVVSHVTDHRGSDLEFESV